MGAVVIRAQHHVEVIAGAIVQRPQEPGLRRRSVRRGGNVRVQCRLPVRDHADATPVLEHEGGDQFRITPGPAGRVLMREDRPSTEGTAAVLGAPVVVGGRVGRGTVVLVGFLSGYLQAALAPEEARLLAALAKYRASSAG